MSCIDVTPGLAGISGNLWIYAQLTVGRADDSAQDVA